MIYVTFWPKNIIKCVENISRKLKITNGLFAPTSRSPMSNIFRDSESLGKSAKKKWSKLTFMGTLQVRTKWNHQSWIQIFQIKFLFLVLSFWNRIALVYFLKTDWSYTFLKVQNSNKNFNLKKGFEMLEMVTPLLQTWDIGKKTVSLLAHLFLLL